ncbi:hypothetical protein [Clostridium perfringens]|uniref:hypothetical protein n=1 Tax=Clostridium perfringens TaxID=1502 RepID=UPI003D3530F8
MRLYHVSLLKNGLTEVFYPRIPKFKSENENNTIGRICLSDSVENAFKGACLFDDFSECLSEYYDWSSIPFVVYVFDTDCVEEGNILTPDYLYKHDFVRDAIHTNEYWIVNQEIKPIDKFFIRIDSYSYVHRFNLDFNSYLKCILSCKDPELTATSTFKIPCVDQYSIISKKIEVLKGAIFDIDNSCELDLEALREAINDTILGEAKVRILWGNILEILFDNYEGIIRSDVRNIINSHYKKRDFKEAS